MANIMETSENSSYELQDSPNGVLLEELKDQDKLSMEQVVEIFINRGFNSPERLAKELVWELVEKGKVKFNDDWLLELDS